MLNDANVAESGQRSSPSTAGTLTLRRQRADLGDGSAETDGSFFFYTGAGDDVVSGGQLADTFTLSATGGPGGTDIGLTAMAATT